MAIHNYSYYYLPILRAVQGHDMLHRLAVADAVADHEGLSVDERIKTNARGTVIFQSRIHWAIQYLVMSGALIRPQRGQISITQRGIDLMKAWPEGFDNRALEDFQELQDWMERTRSQRIAESSDAHIEAALSQGDESPEEQIASALDQIDAAVAAELLNRVLQLLHAMGYGDSQDDLTHTGASGDEGVDGYIKQDKLGLQNLYVQAKRYAPGNTIGRPALQGFVGAIAHKANAGVFITTSSFSREALEYVNAIRTPRVILIDGQKLGRLLVEYEIGVRIKRTHKYLEVDEDFFLET